MLMEEYWYPAVPSVCLGDVPLHVDVLGQDIVLFRDGHGLACALLDMCCHDYAPLSRGQVVNGTISCPYHGWCFDAKGKCVKIPSLLSGQRIPKHLSVQQFECWEGLGYVWVKLAPSNIGVPVIPELADSRFARRIQGTGIWECSWIDALRNNLDVAHLQILHQTADHAGIVGLRELRYEMRVTESMGILLFAPVTASASQSPPEMERSIFSIRYEPPCRIVIHLPTRNQAGQPGRFVTVMHFIPIENGCRYEWTSYHPDFPEGIQFSEAERQIAQQDRELLEAREKRVKKYTPPKPRITVVADSPGMVCSRIADIILADQQWDYANFHPKRKVLTIRG